MLEELHKRNLNCTGCGACYNICPINAIIMEPDAYGFLQPIVQDNLCINCGKCLQTCPVLTPQRNTNYVEPECYAAVMPDNVRHQSSSGGAFTALADVILMEGGVVFGAAIGSDLSVRHIGVQTQEELTTLRKSKYVQSEVGLIYREVKTALVKGQKVLFSGCPCQIASLKSYLGERKYANLYTVDILCHGVPSQKMLRESIQALTEQIPAVGVDFRDKDYGWESLAMTVILANGTRRRLSYNESRYEQGFHPGMTLRESCYYCLFCDFPRQGDLTIGDFWNVMDYDSDLTDGKGTSAILVNSQKGGELLAQTQNMFKMLQPVPMKYLEQNRITPDTAKDPGRDFFLHLYPKLNFNQAVLYAQQNKHDIGIVGNWSYPNYGSELTYYALYTVLNTLGYETVMLSWPQNSTWKPYPVPQLFLQNPYPLWDIAPLPSSRDALFCYNDRCDTFVLGSDQLLNNNLYNCFDKFAQMDWVRSNKRKIAYAVSFGTDYIWGSDDDRAELAHFLQQFDSISVREPSGKTLLKQYYGVNAQSVLDPVFLMPAKMRDSLADVGRDCLPKDKYLFAYILDPKQEKADVLHTCGTKLGMQVLSVSDAAPEMHRLENSWNIETAYDIKLEQWLAYIRSCDYMITDSFHGMCMAILYQRPFLAICNTTRGAARFTAILSLLGLQDRLLLTEKELPEKLSLLDQMIDYAQVNKKLAAASQESLQWLQNALSTALPPKELSDYDLLAPCIAKVNQKTEKCLAELEEFQRQGAETDALQWTHLEDHKNRLAGLEKLQREGAETDASQWTQLEGHNQRLTALEKLQKEGTETDASQWVQIEDHRRRLDGIDAKINELHERMDILEQRWRWFWKK
ncbi:polysaccharide pyruvyl transferase family protein [Caproiciproducens sp. R1]|uniref:polysaccharide pyruvyl transferase family protein n=1 Tax=Caproiciproducens sp. R1 TaxID=3435000 RepID=UPI004033A218